MLHCMQFKCTTAYRWNLGENFRCSHIVMGECKLTTLLSNWYRDCLKPLLYGREASESYFLECKIENLTLKPLADNAFRLDVDTLWQIH